VERPALLADGLPTIARSMLAAATSWPITGSYAGYRVMNSEVKDVVVEGECSHYPAGSLAVCYPGYPDAAGAEYGFNDYVASEFVECFEGQSWVLRHNCSWDRYSILFEQGKRTVCRPLSLDSGC
jgi:hypothetical protein